MLERVNGPEDLKLLDADELKELCAELREKIVQTVTRTGGHLSSSLGAVELTVALHRVFDSPVDRIVWDVGHQSYAHKLLTGRAARFGTLRQYGGLSGFPEPAESEHDAFVAGHAGTSISAAMGMAMARDRAGDKYDVVAVVGDGGLTCGMAYEALNHVGQAGTRLIVVLNDNGMSISPTVGSLARRLQMLRTGPVYSRLKSRVDDTLRGLPKGRSLRWVLRRLKAGVRAVVAPVTLFEQLGLTYLGPVDGHDIESLESALRRARTLRRATVVHVVTRKGKGSGPAEADPVGYHGLAPKGERDGSGETFSDVFADAIGSLLREDPRVTVITAAMLDGTGLRRVAAGFPGRVLDVGLSEEHAVTLAAGLAVGGMRPVVAIYSTFLQRAFDQMVHDVCLPRLPVVFALDRSGIVGEDGKTHQGVFDLAYLGLMPHMTVAAPRDGEQLRRMLRWAVGSPGPVALRYPRARVPGPVAPLHGSTTYDGKAEMLRDGKDVLIVALGAMVGPAMETSEALRSRGIEAAVMDACLAKPLERELLCGKAAHYRAVVTVEDHVRSGGFGSMVLVALQDAGLHDVRVARVALPDEFIPHGERGLLLSAYGLDAEGIEKASLALLDDV